MEWTILLATLLPGALLILMGYLIRFRHMYWLISGYNTMSKDKKKNVDTAGLGVMMGNTLFVMGGLLLVGSLLFSLKLAVLGTIVVTMMVPAIIYLLIGAQKFDGNTRSASGTTRPGAKILIGFIVISIVALTGFVGFMLFRGSQAPAITFANSTLAISGLYGQQIPVTDLKTVQLIDTLPKVLSRTNGSAIGDQLGGHFTLEGIGAAMLYLNRSKPPFIVIETASQKVYLNLATPDETRALYAALQAAKK